MTPEHSHHPSGPLVLAAGLAAVAGFVDAFVYQHVTPVFVANMSGNLIRLGMFTGDADWRPALGAGVALMVFLAGVLGATVANDRQLKRSGSVRATSLLACEAVLLAVLTLVLAVGHVGFDQVPTLAQYPAIVIGGLAMGIQATALRRVGSVAVSTTYGTGALVRLGEKVALGLRRADRAAEHRRRITILVLAAVIACYVLGAVIASMVGASEWMLLVPTATVAAAVVALHLSERTNPDPGRGSGFDQEVLGGP
jgi:uncharacterized membrane protein YoaK (UPF0700 family)